MPLPTPCSEKLGRLTVARRLTTPLQARLMRNTQPGAVIFTLAEAADLAMSLGEARPTSLWQVAVEFSAPAPDGAPEGPAEDPEDADDPWD